MSKPKDKLIIIDGNALIHRSFHALPTTMKTKTGEITNAVYGFTTVLMKALKEFKPEYIVLTLDRKEPTVRHKEYKEYKATRVKAPDELYEQIPRIKEIARAFNIPIFEKAGFEADDLIGTIAKKVQTRRGASVQNIIVTGDLDTLQLVDEHTKVYTMSHGLSDSLLYDEKLVAQRYGGLKPDQLIDFKALRGDPSDNIPGVPGIGEKGAIDLIKEFDAIENLYKKIRKDKYAKKLKPRTLELLKEHKDKAFMSKKLATIICDVKIDFNLQDAQTRDFSSHDVIRIFNELEFRSLMPRLQELNQKLQPANKDSEAEQGKFAKVQKEFNYKLISDQIAFDKFFAELKKQKEFTYDTETASFNSLQTNLLGISFSWEKGKAYYVNVKGQNSKLKGQKSLFDDNRKRGDATSPSENGVDLNYVLKNLKPIFEDSKILKVCHNAKFDIEVISSFGVDIKGVDFDTMVASYLLDPVSRQHNLDATVFKYLHYEKISKNDLLGTGRNKITFSEVKTERLALYSCEDADFTFQLYKKLEPELRKQELDKLFNEIEIPLLPVLVDMEQTGIKLNISYLAKLQKNFASQINALTKKIHKIAGKQFNINSTQQLQEVLFQKLQIPTQDVKKTKTGFSTGAEELQKLRGQHEIIGLISQYRELTKLQNTYIEALPKLVNKKDERVHTSYNQTITATGRLSSSDPNLQNIPIRTEEGRKIRKSFVSQRGYKLISADYSQIELRLAAAISNDTKMIKAFKEGQDIHATTAAEINDVPLKEVTKAMRREAKAINFGILYGQGPFGLAQAADIPQAKAKEFIDKYFDTYTGVKKFIDKCINDTKKTGYVKTLFGRTRPIPEINSTTVQIRKAAERAAINTPLQGTAADIMKIAMINVHEKIAKFNKNAKILLQVHDELVMEVKNDLVKKIAEIVKEEMENVIKLSTQGRPASGWKVPITVDVSVGDNWEEMKKI